MEMSIDEFKELVNCLMVEELEVPDLINKIENEILITNLKEENKERILQLLEILKNDSIKHASILAKLIEEVNIV
ncbi:MAG TPA: hypothetical protein EYH04_02355 [Archaeoglobus profundus]|nr:hypothetical protein [Archaeoglobus profundus]